MRHHRPSSIVTILIGRVIPIGLLTIGLLASVLFIGGCDYSGAFLVHNDYGYYGRHRSGRHYRQPPPPPRHHHSHNRHGRW